MRESDEFNEEEIEILMDDDQFWGAAADSVSNVATRIARAKGQISQYDWPSVDGIEISDNT